MASKMRHPIFLTNLFIGISTCFYFNSYNFIGDHGRKNQNFNITNLPITRIERGDV
jgi:hypothetical protein